MAFTKEYEPGTCESIVCDSSHDMHTQTYTHITFVHTYIHTLAVQNGKWKMQLLYM